LAIVSRSFTSFPRFFLGISPDIYYSSVFSHCRQISRKPKKKIVERLGKTIKDCTRKKTEKRSRNNRGKTGKGMIE
jgi:hypothetical protein